MITKCTTILTYNFNLDISLATNRVIITRLDYCQETTQLVYQCAVVLQKVEYIPAVEQLD